MRWWLTLGVFVLLAAPAAADPLSDYATAVEGRSEREFAELEAARAECSLASATRIDPHELMIDSAGLHGQCVTISGFMHNRHIYPAPYYLYLSQRWASENRRLLAYGRTNPFHFGIDRSDIELPEIGPWFYRTTVTGVVKDCETFGEVVQREGSVLNMNRHGGGIVISMLTGYCHMEYGGVIQPADIDYEEQVTALRLVGDDARERYGSLRQFEPTLTPHLELIAKTQQYLASLAHGYPPSISMLHYGEEEAEALRAYLERPDAPLRDFVTFDGDPEIAVFEDFRYRPLPEDEVDPADQVAAICACRVEDCVGRWPIAYIDALPAPNQPYVCFREAFAAERDVGPGVDSYVVSPLLPPPGWSGSPFREMVSTAPN